MLSFVDACLKSFQPVFSRRKTWILFAMIIFGFLGSSEIIGVSSFCRFWALDVNGYYSLLHFFRSNAWSLQSLQECWEWFVLTNANLIWVNDRLVLLGDHTSVPKDGRKMPGVVSIHQDSETQSKPSYFRGTCWGAVGLLIGTGEGHFCLPLSIKIHQGFNQIGKDKEKTDQSMGLLIVQSAIDFAQKNKVFCTIILDAFFPSGKILNLAKACPYEASQPWVCVLVRAKKNFVGFRPAVQPKRRKRGRPKKYGDAVYLSKLFNSPFLFSKVECMIYGKQEEIEVFSWNLLWKPVQEKVRFILVKTSHGQIILMSNDLTLDEKTAIELYCQRVRIETMFDMLKHLIGTFQYHFWSGYMPRNSRTPKKNSEINIPTGGAIKPVQKCWEATERFVMIGAIALGLLQILSLKYTRSVWKGFNVFLRTRSRKVPSERTVRHVFSKLLLAKLCYLPQNGTLGEIRANFPQVEIDYSDPFSAEAKVNTS